MKNNLIGGKIPEKQECPFLKECYLRVADCPSKKNLKKEKYSCDVARAHALVREKGML